MRDGSPLMPSASRLRCAMDALPIEFPSCPFSKISNIPSRYQCVIRSNSRRQRFAASMPTWRIGSGGDRCRECDIGDARARDPLPSSYRKDDGSPAVWLMGIARQCVDDAEMSLRERASSSEIEAETREHAVHAAAPTDLPHAMAGLDGRSRDLLALRYGAELSSKEIGRIYEMSAGAVEIALQRALNDLPPA